MGIITDFMQAGTVHQTSMTSNKSLWNKRQMIKNQSNKQKTLEHSLKIRVFNI